MPPDPEKPIEGLLRRYTRRRRERAGEPWTVRPVTRQLLQQEVARQFPKKRSFGSALRELLRPRWLKPLITVAGAASVIILGLILSVRPDTRTDKPTTVTSSADRSKVVANDQPMSQLNAVNGAAGSNQFLVASDNALSPSRDRALQQDLQSAPFAENRTTQEKKEAAPAAPAALTLADNKKDQAASAPDATPPAPIAQDSFAAATSTAAGVSSGLAAASPKVSKEIQTGKAPAQREGNSVSSFARAEPGVALGKTAPEKSKPVMQYGLFNASQTPLVSASRQQEALSRNTQLNSALGVQPQNANAQSVLRSFNVEQTGRELRVIDSDGSVYAGPVQTTNTLPVALIERRGLQDQAASKRGFQSFGIQESEMPSTVSSFQLTGTNKTLNRRVLFNGILTTNRAIVAGRAFVQNTGGIASSANRVQANQHGQNLHLSGTAEIEGEPPVRIEASPATQ